MDSLMTDFEPIFKEYIDDVDLSVGMCYLVDICHQDALIYLAGQFNVLGNRGWNVAQAQDEANILVNPTDDPYKYRRNLVRTAIEVSKRTTTPNGIIQALTAIGFPNTVVTEGGFTLKLDGTWLLDGSEILDGGSSGWVKFSVTITTAQIVTPEIEAQIIILINEFKPKRSSLKELIIIN